MLFFFIKFTEVNFILPFYDKAFSYYVGVFSPSYSVSKVYWNFPHNCALQANSLYAKPKAALQNHAVT